MDGVAIKIFTGDTLDRNYIDITQGSRNPPKTVAEVWKEAGIDQEVKVDISKEGMEAYKKHYQSQEPSKVLSISITSEGLKIADENMPAIDDFVNIGTGIREMFRKKISQDWYHDDVSVKKKASILLRAYAEAYDEIVTGHENGTRVMYVVDNKAKDLYRQATLEEELESLTWEFGLKARHMEIDNEVNCKIRRDEMMDVVQGQYLMNVSEQLKIYDKYQALKDDDKITDIKQKMLDAAAEFASQYKEYGLSRLKQDIL